MDKQLLEIGTEESDYQKSKQKELSEMQEKEKKLKEKNEKLTYDQQKEKQNKEFLVKHHDVLHKDQIHSKKLDVYAQILAQIAQKDSSYATLLGPIAEDLKVIGDIESATCSFNQQQ